MYAKKDDSNFKTPLEGVNFKTLVHGEKTSMHLFHLDKGAKIPTHKHPHEQTGYLVSGKMNFTLGDETFLAEPGTSWNIAGDVEHSVDVLEDCVVVEVFAPVREDYLD